MARPETSNFWLRKLRNQLSINSPVSRLVSVVNSSGFNIISCDWIIIFPLYLIKLISFVLFAAVLGSDKNKSMLTCCRD